MLTIAGGIILAFVILAILPAALAIGGGIIYLMVRATPFALAIAGVYLLLLAYDHRGRPEGEEYLVWGVIIVGAGAGFLLFMYINARDEARLERIRKGMELPLKRGSSSK
ncbi:MAG: hypothetical protein KA106_01695 [Ferrovibrio sp.]|nr:hypothetical protein [Ferrovibrio sp.]